MQVGPDQPQYPSSNVGSVQPPTVPPAGHNAPHSGYNPPATGYYQPSNYPAVYNSQNDLVMQQQVIGRASVPTLDKKPVRIVCPSCSTNVLTSTTYETGAITWTICAVLFFVGCFLGCCLIPFCLNSCKEVIHHCPNCRYLVGKHGRM